MMEINKVLKLLFIYFAILLNFTSCKLNEEQKKKYLEEAKVVFEKLKIVPNKDNEIDQGSMTKYIRYIFGGYSEETKQMKNTNVEEEFMFIVTRKLLRGQPEMIKVENIPDIMDPEKLETLTNALLKDFRMDRLQKDIADSILKQQKEKEKKEKTSQPEPKMARVNKKVEKTPREDSIDL